MGSPSELYRSMEPLFRPRNVAIVGASATPFKQGNTALRYLLQGGFDGGIYPVNPAGGEIEGVRTYKSISEIDQQIDCALFVIPAGAVVPAIRECAANGVKAAIIGANGFAELGSEAGIARQQELTDIARSHGIRIVGPNTNGIWNATDKLSLGYNTSHGDDMTPGPVSIAAHSGALFNSIAPSLRRFGAGLSKFVPVGNEADLDMLDFLEYYIEDPATQVIGLIVEALRSGERLRVLAARAQAAGKSIVALKLGRSAAGAGAALAHSSRLAGSARAYAALFHDCGVLQVRSIESMAGACALLCHKSATLTAGKRGLIAVTTSGGGGGLIADHAADFDIPLAGDPDGSWTGRVAELIKTFDGAGPIFNPIDGGNLAGWPRLEQILKALEADAMTGPVLFFGHMLPQPRMDKAVQEILTRRKQRTGAPVICVAPGGLRVEIQQAYMENSIPVFTDLGTCFAALKALYEAMAGQKTPDFGGRTILKPMPHTMRKEISALLARAGDAVILSELESAELLRTAGVPLVASQKVASEEEAVATAIQTGWPIALKGLAPGIAHKNDAGLVCVGLNDEQGVRDAYRQLMMRLVSINGGKNNEVIIQPMISANAEFIAGLTCEEPLGQFLIAGLGGIYAEILDEIILFHVPVSPEAMLQRLRQGRLGALLQEISPDGKALETFVASLQALQAIALNFGSQISSIDLNPVLIRSTGAIAVDALITLAGGNNVESDGRPTGAIT